MIDAWSGKRYLDRDDYHEWKQADGQLKTVETVIPTISINRDEPVLLL